MQSIIQWLLESKSEGIMLGLTIIRIGIGTLFMGHGFLKLQGGMQQWQWLGSQMGNFGIHFAPAFWGFCAMCAELLGGVALTVGFCTRVAAVLICCVMIVAIVYHVSNGDGYTKISFPLSELIIMIGLIIAGGGTYSLDNYFLNN